MTSALGSLPLGGTPDGKAWCRKALHPADHEIMATRFPGGSAVPTVSSNFTQVMELVPDPAVQGHVTSWNVRVFLRQDPVVPASIVVTTMVDNGTSTVRSFPWINRTVSNHEVILADKYSIPGTKTLNESFEKFVKGKNFYRLTHLGLTMEHVCSSTTNQGTVLSGQYAIEPTITSLTGYPFTERLSDGTYVFGTDLDGQFPARGTISGPDAGQFMLHTAPQVRHYGEGPMDEQMLLQATNGYTGSAKDGLYIPLKLDHPSRFINVDKKYILMGNDGDQTVLRQVFHQRLGRWGKTTGWPYHALYDTQDGAGTDPILMVGCKECGSSVSDTVIKGLDPHASFRLYLRGGIEYVPEIDSETACFARMSPLPDELAVRMYQEITCRMKDAFPRDYNDKSKLLQVIDGLAKRLVPAIDKGLNFFSQIPGNPWGSAAAGLRTLTSAYLAPAAKPGGRKGGKPRRSRTAAAGSKITASKSAPGISTQGQKKVFRLSDGQTITIERTRK